MNKAVLVVFAASLALAACGSTPHKGKWDPNGTPRNENWHSPAAALLKYDTDHDGTLTRDELLRGLKAEFDTYDVGHRNCLGAEQVRAINQMRVQEDASQATPLVDWNEDGCIDFREYSGAALSLFDSLDKDGNGKLTAEELNPSGTPGTPQQPAQGHHRGRHGGGGGEQGGGGQ
jgi:Ca2+-binding EF-hand superfamily protein